MTTAGTTTNPATIVTVANGSGEGDVCYHKTNKKDSEGSSRKKKKRVQFRLPLQDSDEEARTSNANNNAGSKRSFYYNNLFVLILLVVYMASNMAGRRVSFVDTTTANRKLDDEKAEVVSAAANSSDSRSSSASPTPSQPTLIETPNPTTTTPNPTTSNPSTSHPTASPTTRIKEITSSTPNPTNKRVPVDPKLLINRTAVVWATSGIMSNCEADRVRHLIDTSPKGMDVWLMHSHPEFLQKGMKKKVKYSQSHIDSLPGLQGRMWPQNVSGFNPFDNLAGKSKSSFLRFLVEHQSQYDYAWIVENDMFFTGPWEGIFQWDSILQDTTTDFLSLEIRHFNRGAWGHNSPQRCKLWDEGCREIENAQTAWMFARVSSKLAISLLHDLEGGHVQGFHEAVLAPYCHLKNFTFGNIDPARVGEWHYGHVQGKENKDMDLSFYKNLQRGKLIHPVKCEAYEVNNKSILPDMEKWTNTTAKGAELTIR